MARVTRIEGQTSDVRRISGTLGQSDVEAGRLRAKAAAIAHPIDTGQTSTIPGVGDVAGLGSLSGQFAFLRPLDSTLGSIGPQRDNTGAAAGAAGSDTTNPDGRVDNGTNAGQPKGPRTQQIREQS